MFLGYLGAPDLIRVSFTDDGWLRAGDLARLDDDGRVVHLGRTGDLINVGGRKVVTREIEDLLAHCGRIAVVGVPDDRLGECPCFITEDPHLTPDYAVMILSGAGVAEHNLPLELVEVDAIPLAPSGKTMPISSTRTGRCATTVSAPHRPCRSTTRGSESPKRVVRQLCSCRMGFFAGMAVCETGQCPGGSRTVGYESVRGTLHDGVSSEKIGCKNEC